MPMISLVVQMKVYLSDTFTDNKLDEGLAPLLACKLSTVQEQI